MSSHATSDGDARAPSWVEIAPRDVAQWDQVLSRTDAHLMQYAFFNERFRGPLVSLRYLYYGSAAAPLAYACIFTVGVPGLRLGIIANGPVSLVAGVPVSLEMMKALSDWARRKGYIFIRVTHLDNDFLESLSALPRVECADPFRTYFAPDCELMVRLVADETQMLRGFQEVARRLIRQAGRADYTWEESDSPEMLEKVWPLFTDLDRRKGLPQKSLRKYRMLMRMAQPTQYARLYIASLDGKPVNAILVVRDRDTALYYVGALDVAALGGRPSPSCLLHYKAMRSLYEQGAKTYNLGIKGQSVHAFKRKFRPTELVYPQPRLIVLRPMLYRLCKVLLDNRALAIASTVRGWQVRAKP